MLVYKFNEKNQRSIIVLKNKDIEILYELYKGTYGPLNEELLGLEVFKTMLMPKKGDNQKYNQLIILEREKKFCNAFLTRKTSYGSRCSYIFGLNDKKNKTERLKFTKEMLQSSYYAEANGPVARQLLKDETVSVKLSLNENYYFGRKGNHGKKIIFGQHDEAVGMSQGGRLFLNYLYTYKAIKQHLKLDVKTEDTYKKTEAKLCKLILSIQKEEKIPDLYRMILLSKIYRKVLFINSGNAMAVEGLRRINQKLSLPRNFKDDVSQFVVGCDQTSLSIKEMQLSKKRSKIYTKGTLLTRGRGGSSNGVGEDSKIKNNII